MRAVNLEALAEVTHALDRLGVHYALTGGVVVGFLVDYVELLTARPTRDIDVIAAVTDLRAYSKLESRMREIGFRHDASDDAPPCRFQLNGIIVDLMPAIDDTGRFSDRWFQHALQTSSRRTLHGITVNTINAPSFVATKLTAFRVRGRGDYFSHDLEDILAVIDGRASFLNECERESTALRDFIAQEIRSLLSEPRFVDALPGHLGSDAASQLRLPRLLDCLNRLAGLRANAPS